MDSDLALTLTHAMSICTKLVVVSHRLIILRKTLAILRGLTSIYCSQSCNQDKHVCLAVLYRLVSDHLYSNVTKQASLLAAILRQSEE
jgi:hypothetical protein